MDGTKGHDSKNLRSLFKDRVSSKAIQIIDGETRIIGKFGQIAAMGEKFDLWFVQPEYKPMTPRKLTAIAKKCQQLDGFTVLTGEAYGQTRDIRIVDKLLPLMGINRKRRYSDEQKKIMSERLRHSNIARQEIKASR